MTFVLKHHFDPDWDPNRLTPQEQSDGSVNHHELNFVSSVSAGDLIAEWVPMDEIEGSADPRFLSENQEFPAGHGTGVKKQCPGKLYAAVDGYAGYKDGKIVVRGTLKVSSDIDYHTGNIDFVGNVAVAGSIRAGFEVVGRDVSVQGQIEGADVKARQSLKCLGGVKGGKEAFVESAKDIKLAFCEYGVLKARSDIMVKGALMHSDAYAGRRLAVGGRMTGGNFCAYEYVYVGEQLGGGLDTDTSIILGYNPALLYADQGYNQRIKKLHEEIASFEKKLNKGEEYQTEYEPKLKSSRRELELLKAMKVKLWNGIQTTERLEKCKVLVPGVVKPGVEISIGSAYLKVDDYLEDVFFYFENNEVKFGASTGKIRS